MKIFANFLPLFALAFPTLCLSQDIAEESKLTIQRREVTARFQSSRTRLGIEYVEALKKLDQGHQELTDDLLSDVQESLEEARKTAMQQENLNRALAMQALLDKYLGQNDTNKPKQDTSEKKDPIEIAYERKLTIAKRDRDMSAKSLASKLLRQGEVLRNDAIKSLETLRSDAMKADNLHDAKQTQDQIVSLKNLDLSEPVHEAPGQVASKSLDKPAAPAQSRVTCVVVIAPIGNTKQTQTFEIPKDVIKVEVSFFVQGAPDTSLSRYPSYRGRLTVNNTSVVRYSKQYKWSDGKTYNVAVCMDGKEINTRDNESVKGAVDISSLAPPGKPCSVSYSNNNRTPTGVRFYLYR